MQLLNDFYTRSNWKQDDHNLSCTIVFNAEHEIFKGHFPDHPVVPGVCTMSCIKQALQDATGKRLVLGEAGAIKFLQLLIPTHEVLLNLTWQEDGDGISAQASLVNEDRPAFKMNATYKVVA